MNPLERAKATFSIEINELQKVANRLNGEITCAVDICSEAIDNGGKIIVVGIGKSGNIGNKIVATLNSTGSPSVILSSQDARHGDMGIVRDGDVIIALSHSGETVELISLIPYLKRFNVKLISMTGHPTSTLGEYSDVVLDTGISREACPLNLAPTCSSTAMLVMGDAIAMALLDSRGFTEEDFARFHPGGALGKALLTKVKDIMRGKDSIAMCNPEESVNSCLEKMTQVRSGACIITEKSGKLAGVFTHGDFVRSYQKNPLIGNDPVAKYMTIQPISVRQNALAAEAVKELGNRRIDDLVVLDDAGEPVGIVDAQDLARLKLV